MLLALVGSRQALPSEEFGELSWYQEAPPQLAPGTRPLLLLHSINAAGSAYEIKPLYDQYCKKRPVYAPDLPGFGLSDRSKRPYTPRLMTDAILALVEKIRSEHAGVAIDVIALSLSCEFLARAATESPDSFHSLALISPTGFNRSALREGTAGSNLGQDLLYSIFSAPAIGRRLFRLLTRRPVIAYFLRRTWGSPHIDEGLLDYDTEITRPPGAEHAPLRFLTGFLFSGDSGTLYRALQVPVWVAHGVRGDFAKYAGLRALQDRPNWTIEVLPTGALPHFEMLPEFTERYEAWLAKLPTGPTVNGP